jgi:hypothetical protein
VQSVDFALSVEDQLPGIIGGWRVGQAYQLSTWWRVFHTEMKINIVIMGFLLFLLSGWVSVAKANLGYGSGYYTNLCDSGTSAKYYSCDVGCNPTLGTCQSTNNGVVRWTCSGKWDQCLASESGWDSGENLSDVACGTTVQLSLFDKKCRREDGSWDNSCRLLGYMVWYSGDCTPGFIKTPATTVATTPTIKSTSTPSPTVKVASTVIPTAVSKLGTTVKPTVKPTVIPTIKASQNICGMKCSDTNPCQAGFSCSTGVCRNPACVDDKSCFCGEVKAAVVSKTPATAETSWWGMLMLMGIGAMGFKMRKLAKKVW